MNNKATQNKTQQNVFKKYKYAIIAVTIIALVLFDFSPFGGNIRFYKKWIECGQKPVASDTSLGFGAKVPSYVEVPAFQPMRFGQPKYFCTSLEAEKDGYSTSSEQYEFRYSKEERRKTN